MLLMQTSLRIVPGLKSELLEPPAKGVVLSSARLTTIRGYPAAIF